MSEEMWGDWPPTVDNEQATMQPEEEQAPEEQALGGEEWTAAGATGGEEWTAGEETGGVQWTAEMEQAWQETGGEQWMAEMEQAWRDSRSWPPNAQEEQEEEVPATGEEDQQEMVAMDEVSFGTTGMLYTRSLDAHRTPREILKYRFEDPLQIAKCLEGFNVWRIYQPLWEP